MPPSARKHVILDEMRHVDFGTFFELFSKGYPPIRPKVTKMMKKYRFLMKKLESIHKFLEEMSNKSVEYLEKKYFE